MSQKSLGHGPGIFIGYLLLNNLCHICYNKNAQEDQEIEKQDTSIKKPSLQSIYPTAINSSSVESFVGQPIVETPKTGAQKTGYPGWYSIASFISALIPIALWIYAFALLANAKNPNDYSGIGKAFSVGIVVYYYVSIGLPMAAFSIGTGIRGLKSDLHTLARISLFLKFCTIIFVLFVLFSK